MASSTIKKAVDNLISTSTEPWPGNTLTFEIPADNKRLYKLFAMETGAEAVEALVIIRQNTLVYKNLLSDNTVTMTYSNGVLTVTLPKSSYWVYSMVALN